MGGRGRAGGFGRGLLAAGAAGLADGGVGRDGRLPLWRLGIGDSDEYCDHGVSDIVYSIEWRVKMIIGLEFTQQQNRSTIINSFSPLCLYSPYNLQCLLS